jgi:hypothetical protein
MLDLKAKDKGRKGNEGKGGKEREMEMTTLSRWLGGMWEAEGAVT